MSKTTVYNIKGEKVKEIDLNPKIFGLEVKVEVVTQAVIAQQNNARNNLANVKDRSDVSGGGKKPWKQKGTGRARHGSIRSPLWRGGGITFGPSKVQNYSIKINKKARRKAILMSLSDKATNHKVVLVDNLELEEGKTKKFFEILQNLELRSKKVGKTKQASIVKDSKKENKQDDAKNKKVNPNPRVLVVLPKKDDNILRAAKNIERAEIIKADSLNVVDLVKAKYLLMPVDSLEVIEKTFIK